MCSSTHSGVSLIGEVQSTQGLIGERIYNTTLQHYMSNLTTMEPDSKDEKSGAPKKVLVVEDEDEYPGILPCQGRKGGLYPGVRQSSKNIQD